MEEQAPLLAPGEQPAVGCVIRRLLAIAYAKGYTLWCYPGQDPVGAVLAPGFWDGIADMLAAGDRINVSGPQGAIDLHVARVERRRVWVRQIAASEIV